MSVLASGAVMAWVSGPFRCAAKLYQCASKVSLYGQTASVSGLARVLGRRLYAFPVLSILL